MGSLNNLYVSSSFQGLMKLTNSATGLTNTLQTIQAGDGSDSPLQMSLTAINISGSFTVNNLPITGSTSGTSGTSGSSGTSGISGSSGTAGTSGSSGSSGTSGANGSSGSSGTSGINGTSGTSGFNGSSGSSGTAGSSGTSGTSGVSGTDGSSGTSGSSGSSGTTGSSGTSGVNGSSGTSGSSGVSPSLVGVITTGSLTSTQQITGSLILGNTVISGSLVGNTVNGGLLNFIAESRLSGSVQLNISSSSPVSQSNLLLNGGGPSNAQLTGSIVISGSNNIIMNPSRLSTLATQGSYGYIGGNNIVTTIPTLNTASLVSPSILNNNLNSTLTLAFTTSSVLAVPSITNNQILNTTTITHPSGSLQLINNIIGGAFSSTANTTTLSAQSQYNSNIIGGAGVTLNQANSSVAIFQQNVGGGITVQNNYTSSVSTAVNNINVNRNTFGGSTNIITVTGSNSANRRQFNDNAILGIGNRINSDYSTSTAGHLTATALIGQNLIVSASHTSVTVGGTVIVGRFNQTGSLQESSQDNVFIVGNGGSDGSRRNAIRVDASGNIYLTGSVRVSGSITNFGGGNINNNTTYGDNTLPANTTGTNNIAFGNNALQLNITGSFNTAIGSNALSKSQTSNNTGIGSSALQNLIIGSLNMAIGTNTLQQNVSGSFNTAIGNSALQNGVSGSQNIAIGFNALQQNSADNNLAIGFTAMAQNTTGQGNTAIGANNPLGNNTTGNNNTVIGNAAFTTNVSGSGNIAIGRTSGLGETGDNNLYINSLAFAGLDASRSGSIIYGKMNSTTANQSLQINAGQVRLPLIPNVTGSYFVMQDATGSLSYATTQQAILSAFSAGAFYSTGSVTATANVSGSFVYDSTVDSQGITYSGSQITVSRTGLYNIQFSTQINNGSGAAEIAIWLKKNGSNISNTATRLTVPSNHNDVLALNLWDNATAGDYYELTYQSDSSNTSFATIASSGNIPTSPSIIVTINQVR